MFQQFFQLLVSMFDFFSMFRTARGGFEAKEKVILSCSKNFFVCYTRETQRIDSIDVPKKCAQSKIERVCISQQVFGVCDANF